MKVLAENFYWFTEIGKYSRDLLFQRTYF